MYLPQYDISETIPRQRNKHKELNTALFKNKTKLSEMQQEITILTQPLCVDYEDECQRLDGEITKLRHVCQAMANELENLKRRNEEHIVEQRQPLRPAPPPPPCALPRIRPKCLFGNQQSISSSSSQLSPQSPGSQPRLSPVSPNQITQEQSPQPKNIDEGEVGDRSSTDQSWQCSMCTFQNHPLLNKCECCENVRVEPGSVRILPTRPPPPPPTFVTGSRSAPQTPGTPATPRILSHLPNNYTSHGMPNSISENNLTQFSEDILL